MSFTSLEYFGGEVRSRSGIGFPCHRCATEQLGFQVVADRTDVRRNFCRGHGVAARRREVGARQEEFGAHPMQPDVLSPETPGVVRIRAFLRGAVHSDRVDAIPGPGVRIPVRRRRAR